MTPPVRRTFPGQQDQVACARDFVKRVVGGCPMLDEAVLLTSELCTNTLQHTASGRGGSFEVTVYRAHDSLRVEVRDDGSKTVPAIRGFEELSEDGRGLELVDLIASRWGQNGDEYGRSVFFELRWNCPRMTRLRVAYVDNDPVVLTHARAILAGGPGVAVVAGDMRDPDAILGSPDLRALIDLRQPACVILASVLHFVAPDEADAIVTAFTTAMVCGSHLILSAGTSTGTSPALIERLQAAYQGTTIVTGRTEAQIAAYFHGLDLVPPGLTDVQAWRPEHGWRRSSTSARILGGVARKPCSRGRCNTATGLSPPPHRQRPAGRIPR